MTPEAVFLGLLGLTVALLGGVAWTGRQRRLRPHLILVACAVASLALAIVAALRVGERYDLAAASWITPVHLGIARVATVSFMVPLVTGPFVVASRLRPRLHHWAAWAAIGLTVAAAATGAWMLWLAPATY